MKKDKPENSEIETFVEQDTLGTPSECFIVTPELQKRLDKFKNRSFIIGGGIMQKN